MRNLLLRITLLFFFSFFASQQLLSQQQQTTFTEGSGYFEFSGHPALKGQKMRVFYHIPDGENVEMPFLFVMHGVLRNANTYRDNWIDLSNKYNFIVLVPEFTQELFPKSRSYNYGNMFDIEFFPVSKELWTFSLIDPIFDYVVQEIGSNQENYDLFGHSAGSQFAHRYFLFMGQTKANRIIASNAGTYTMLDESIEFPYGLKDTDISSEEIKRLLQNKLIIHLGEEDTDPNHKYLNVSAQAMAQGPNRFERGKNFFNRAKKTASDLGVHFGWELRTVPKVAHNNGEMAIDIAKYLFK